MPSGLQIFGPQGQTWFDTNDMTTRVMGSFVITSGSTGLPNLGPPNYSSYIDFACPPTVTPWMFYTGSNNVTIVGSSARLNSTSARITFNLSYPEPFPAGGKITIYYGYGR